MTRRVGRARLSLRLRRSLPRPATHAFFERLHGFALTGMGIGSAVWPVEHSGEAHLLRVVARSGVVEDLDRTILLDVGANHGDWAAAALDAFRDAVEVHCFEPGAGAFARLEQRFAGHPSIFLHRLAAADRGGTSMLHTRPGHSQLSSLLPLDVPDAAAEEVEAVRLDDWVAEGDVPEVAFLKIDVEGAELAVLRGATRMLTDGRVRLVQFEYGLRNRLAGDRFADFGRLLGDRYVVHRVLPNGIARVDALRPEGDIPQSATNYLAVRSDLVDRW